MNKLEALTQQNPHGSLTQAVQAIVLLTFMYAVLLVFGSYYCAYVRLCDCLKRAADRLVQKVRERIRCASIKRESVLLPEEGEVSTF